MAPPFSWNWKTAPGIRRDGSAGNPKGEMTLFIEWSWRIEESVDLVWQLE